MFPMKDRSDQLDIKPLFQSYIMIVIDFAIIMCDSGVRKR
jgi:hypothetical protein